MLLFFAIKAATKAPHDNHQRCKTDSKTTTQSSSISVNLTDTITRPLPATAYNDKNITYDTTAHNATIMSTWNTYWPPSTHTNHKQQWRIHESIVDTNLELINLHKLEGYFDFCDKTTKKELDKERQKREKINITTEPYYGYDDYDDISDYGYEYITTLTHCTCHDFQRRKLPCKHIYRLFWEIEHANKIANCPAMHSMDHDYFYEIFKIDKYMTLFKDNHMWLKDNEIKYRSAPDKLIKYKYYIETDLILEHYLDTLTKDALITLIAEQNINDIKKSWTKSKIIESLLDTHHDITLRAIGGVKAYCPDPALHEIALYNTPSDFLENDPEEINKHIKQQQGNDSSAKLKTT